MDRVQAATDQWQKLESTVAISRMSEIKISVSKMMFKEKLVNILIFLGGGGTAVLMFVDKIAHMFGICLGF